MITSYLVIVFFIVAIRKTYLTLATTLHPPAHRSQSIVAFDFLATPQVGPLKTINLEMTQQEKSHNEMRTATTAKEVLIRKLVSRQTCL